MSTLGVISWLVQTSESVAAFVRGLLAKSATVLEQVLFGAGVKREIRGVRGSPNVKAVDPPAVESATASATGDRTRTGSLRRRELFPGGCKVEDLASSKATVSLGFPVACATDETLGLFQMRNADGTLGWNFGDSGVYGEAAVYDDTQWGPLLGDGNSALAATTDMAGMPMTSFQPGQVGTQAYDTLSAQAAPALAQHHSQQSARSAANKLVMRHHEHKAGYVPYERPQYRQGQRQQHHHHHHHHNPQIPHELYQNHPAQQQIAQQQSARRADSFAAYSDAGSTYSPPELVGENSVGATTSWIPTLGESDDELFLQEINFFAGSSGPISSEEASTGSLPSEWQPAGAVAAATGMIPMAPPVRGVYPPVHSRANSDSGGSPQFMPSAESAAKESHHTDLGLEWAGMHYGGLQGGTIDAVETSEHPALSSHSSDLSDDGLSPHASSSGSSGPHQFVCPECDATFRIKGYLTRHLKKHADKKAYTCPFFDHSAETPCHSTGGFSRRDTYKTHLKARHFVYPPGTKSGDRRKTSGRCGGCQLEFVSNEVWVEDHIQTGECAGLHGL